MKPQQVFLFIVFTVFGLQAVAEEKIYSQYFESSDGLKIHYVISGTEGSYVVLVHAYGTDVGSWINTGILQALAKNHRVVAIDCRNHGKSDKPNPNRFGIASDVVELMDHLKIEKAHLHGYSMGGGIVSQILLAQQDRIITASLGGSGIGERDPERIAELPKDKESKRAGQPSPTRPGPKQSVEFITVPVLALVGEYDNPSEKTTRMQREIKNFDKVIIRNRGHRGTMIDKKYRSEVVKFINKNDGD